MSTVAKPDEARSLSEKRARKAAAEIHALNTAELIADRIKDPTALERALIHKLEAQREFAAEYKTMFPQGGDRGENQYAKWQDDRSGVLPPDKWCLGFGFHVRAVQRWCALLEADEYGAKQKAIIKKCWELAELWPADPQATQKPSLMTPLQPAERERR
jgi:hypothetical protein